MSDPYADIHEYLSDYFALLALHLHREVTLTRLLRGPATDEAFLGLFLSEAELDVILAGLHGLEVPAQGRTVELEGEIEALSERMSGRLAATPYPLPPQQLAQLFDLPPETVELLLILLAPEVDSRFGRVFAYLQDDVTSRWLTPEVALRLLPGLTPDSPDGRALFTAGATAVRERLIHVAGSNPKSPTPLINRPLKLDDRIAEFLLDHDILDPHLVGLAEVEMPDVELAALSLEESTKRSLNYLAAMWQAGDAAPAFFWGAPGSGKSTVAAALASCLKRPVVTLSGADLADRPPQLVADILAFAYREVRLRGAVLHLRRLDSLDDGRREQVAQWSRQGVIFSARSRWAVYDWTNPPLVIHFPVPAHGIRQMFWRRASNGYVTEAVTAVLANRFQLTPGQIVRATTTANQRAWLREGQGTEPNAADLFAGARQLSNPNLGKLAVKVNSPYDWDNLVLPRVQIAQLKAIEGQVRYTHTVLYQWGFDSKLALGKGLTALFSGPSGTGKTMSAGILTRSLGLDMYKVDLSGVVSKYIGETEKNLSRIFDEASTASAILFFDEADAIFGKRSEVKDAHDRYANIEISYLLQKMEEYEGVAILATNFSQNIDDAFTRRLQHLIEFPFPSAEDRERIWRGMFPAGAPVAGDLDFAFLAGQFELTGGNIKNCVLAAAYQAAEEGTEIGMDHLIHGVVRELDKLGQPLTRTAFADYYNQARRR